jgi:hypothetical protein
MSSGKKCKVYKISDYKKKQESGLTKFEQAFRRLMEASQPDWDNLKWVDNFDDLNFKHDKFGIEIEVEVEDE